MIPVSLALCAAAGAIVPIIPASSENTSAIADQRSEALISCEILARGSVLFLRTPLVLSTLNARFRSLLGAFADRGEEPGAEVGQLLLSYPADAAQLRRGPRYLAGHGAQNRVA